MRDLLLYLHILGAAGWIGGGIYVMFIVPRLARQGTEASSSMTAISNSGNRYFGPVTGLVLLTGIGLVLNSDLYGWGDTFVIIGLGVFVVSALWQPLVASKREVALTEAIAGRGGDVAGAVRSWLGTNAIELALVLFTLWAMIVKLGV